MLFSKFKFENDVRKETIKNAVNLTDFFNDIGIESSNSRYICPFHDDHSPSITIKENIWSCWSCNLIGQDIFEFVKKYYKLNFNQALEFLENKYNLTNAKNIEFSTPLKNKIKKNKKEITFFIDKVEDNISALVKTSNIDYNIRDKIFKKLDSYYIKFEILNCENDDAILHFKDKLIEFKNKIEEKLCK